MLVSPSIMLHWTVVSWLRHNNDTVYHKKKNSCLLLLLKALSFAGIHCLCLCLSLLSTLVACCLSRRKQSCFASVCYNYSDPCSPPPFIVDYGTVLLHWETNLLTLSRPSVHSVDCLRRWMHDRCWLLACHSQVCFSVLLWYLSQCHEQHYG